MKIAVVTNYDKKNYGSVLQAYALQSKIKELSVDNECVVFNVKKSSNKSVVYKIKSFFAKSKNNYSLRNKLQIKKARKLFEYKNKKIEEFCNSNIDNVCCYSYKEAEALSKEYDVFIAGSDQIWSPNAGTLSDITLLNFVNGGSQKKYSYAASIGVSNLDDEIKSKFKIGLNSFDSISVREKTARKVLIDCSNKDIRVDIDPTLLYDNNFWSKKTHKSETNNEPYIFVYMLRPEPITIEVAKALSKKTGYKVKICSNRIVEKDLFENIVDAGIEDFLSLIKNATYVVTNSFHGTVFSLQFHKKFAAVAIEGTGSRVIDLLDSVELSKHIIDSSAQIDIFEDCINWDNVDTILEKKRIESINYIEHMINDNNKEKIVLYNSKKNCCGCGACMNICPQSAIHMEKDIYGFIYPAIDESKCVKCGLCKKVCNFQKKELKNNVIKAYAGVSNNESLRMSSSSGGVFSSIAKSVLEKNGLVYGCTFDKNCVAKHIEINTIEQLSKLQGSKYVQSNIGYIYKQIGKQLKNNPDKPILFSGTPCQIDGLIGFLNNKEYNNLFLIELICHGVPNEEILSSYIDMKNTNKKNKIKSIMFRDKKYGWGEKGCYILENGKKEKIDIYNSSYYKLYLKATFYRENCYSCKYANDKVNRPADITIGDYWGVNEVEKELLNKGTSWDIKKGISCIMVNSNKGEILLKDYGDYLNLAETTLENIRYKNKALTNPPKRNKNREAVLSMFYRGGYAEIEKWYKRKYGFKNKIYKLWDAIPVECRNTIKELKKKVRR